MMKEIKALLASLPHSQNLDKDTVINWLKNVHTTDPNRLLWHLKRAAGVGGSEIGTLLLEAQGLTPPFGNTGQLIAAEKLLQIPPSRPLPHMLRGIILEEPLIEAILAIYGGTRDVAAENTINDSHIPNRTGSPDLYWNLNQKRILVDTKVPISATEVESTGSENAKIFQYKSQLHHYDLIGEEKGIKADKLIIAELDVPVELADAWVKMIRKDGQDGHHQVVSQMTSLLAAENPGMRINFIEVEPDITVNLYGNECSIREAIPLVSDSFMDHLIKGEAVPHYIPEQVELSDAAADELKAIEKRLGNLRAISEYCERETSGTQDYLRSFISQQNIAFDSIKGEMFNFSQKQSMDLDAAEQVLKKYPVDLDSLRKQPTIEKAQKSDLDTTKAFELLKEHGLLEQCLKEPKLDPELVESALTALGENPEAFQKTEVGVRKATSKAAKACFAELAGFTTDIDEFLSLRQLQAQHSEPTEDALQAPSDPPAMKVG
ncbi:hypothetical protein [Neptuniibacter halophilus]|uniref:hypothetical protein n=1 Tax=Neptuniibacter halophilus TaxID=651666 RepID=UPI0025727245|nr:hypothetical protein [Neptuniibacter halophilus]